MRSLALMFPACLLLASSAGAQTQPESMSRVQVQAPTKPFHFRDYEAEAISGAYAMSNGWRMKVDPTADGIVAQIDKRHPFRLVAVSRDKYVSPDGNVSMEFNRGRGDDMLMSYVPDSRTVTLARR